MLFYSKSCKVNPYSAWVTSKKISFRALASSKGGNVQEDLCQEYSLTGASIKELEKTNKNLSILTINLPASQYTVEMQFHNEKDRILYFKWKSAIQETVEDLIPRNLDNLARIYEVQKLRDDYFTFAATHCNRVQQFQINLQPPSVDKEDSEEGVNVNQRESIPEEVKVGQASSDSMQRKRKIGVIYANGSPILN